MTYEDVKGYFISGFWSASLVKVAVRKGIITQEQCDEILALKQK